ncbi:pyridoxamine 5'-phosphate oxidase family protein [Streptomyces sp. 549]|uniref:pyridoxamine 5'-phosphate oxidase family protein n=1 Tax=Streptomyces sp. 549 TaxID=3049076 RepID=UPI0024C3A6CF|nr:pyridoxamine 5'-phosphate oxidase family protein [Streptomyces sp. 549]MDK1475485.1 pyridoxamine 5'-phosphate oxidase family protein [Streptomyces sp. 549]
MAGTEREPAGVLDARFSSPGAQPVPWTTARAALAAAEVYWLTTVRDEGRPHVTPLIGVWRDDALYFCTGPDEQKARNLARSRHCALTTGGNRLGEGLDLVVEGAARQVADEARLRFLASCYREKYGSAWHFEVRDGAFLGDGGRALVFEVRPEKVLGFAKGEPFGQTRWRL